MKRFTQATAAVLAIAALVVPQTPAAAAGPTFSFHTFLSGGLSNSESFDPPGNQPVIGDFRGDENDDILWYTPGAGGDALWTSDGSGVGFEETSATVTGTYLPVAGSFTSDGKQDILWLAATGSSSLWDYNADGTVTRTTLTDVRGTGIPLVGDYTGDDFPDVIAYAAGSAPDLWIDFNEIGAPTIRPFSISGTYRPVSGHFTYNSADDIFWYAPGAGVDTFYDFTTAGSFTPSTQSVTGTYTPLTRSKTEDGVDDIMFYGVGVAADAYWDWNANIAGPTRSNRSLTVKGTYVPYTCQCIGEGVDSGTDVLWFSATGSDVIWDYDPTSASPVSVTASDPNLTGSRVAGFAFLYETGDDDTILTYD